MAGEFGDQELDLVKRDAVRGGGLNADERRHGHGLDREFDRIALAVDQMYDQNNDEVGRQIFPQNQEEQSPLQPEPQTQQQPNTDAVLGADVASGDENGSGGDQRDRQAENEQQQQQQQLEANSDNEEEDDGDETGDDFELHDGQNEAGGGSGGGGWGVLMEGSLRVLLVEDDDSTRHVVSALLRNCSYEANAFSCRLAAVLHSLCVSTPIIVASLSQKLPTSPLPLPTPPSLPPPSLPLFPEPPFSPSCFLPPAFSPPTSTASPRYSHTRVERAARMGASIERQRRAVRPGADGRGDAGAVGHCAARAHHGQRGAARHPRYNGMEITALKRSSSLSHSLPTPSDVVAQQHGDGVEVTDSRSLLTDPPHPPSNPTSPFSPLAVMSSHDSMEMVLKCFQRGAADFLVKPVRKNELKNLWQHVWRRCHSVRPLALSPPLLSPLFPRHSSPPRFAVHSPCIFPQRPLPSLAVPSRPRPSPPVPLVSPS
ncbi:unnamed protein product [Closterium sp. NIES-53]